MYFFKLIYGFNICFCSDVGALAPMAVSRLKMGTWSIFQHVLGMQETHTNTSRNNHPCPFAPNHSLMLFSHQLSSLWCPACSRQYCQNMSKPTLERLGRDLGPCESKRMTMETLNSVSWSEC